MLKLGVTALMAFIVQIFISPHLEVIEAPKSVNFAPPKSLKYFSFGANDLVADIAWLRAIQDLDVCEQTIKGAEAGTGKARVAKCEQGWVYHMLDFVMEMAPRFRMPAAVGPIMLSVVVDDRHGATLLFEKAVENFPDDWSIIFRAAYHFMYEEENLVRAAELYNQAGIAGAPPWVHSLAARLYSRGGQDVIAKIVLEDFLKRTPEGASGRQRVEERLKEINAKLAAAKDTPAQTPKKPRQNK